MFMVVGEIGLVAPPQSVFGYTLNPIKSRQHTERQGVLVLRVEEERQQRIGSLKNKLDGRQRPRGNQTAMNQRQRRLASERKGGSELIAQDPKDDDVVVLGQPKERLGIEGSKGVVCEDLA